jgi:formylglycine-generating enzyme required for sulfatase activity
MTGPVDSFKPNPWGLYQVHGNVFDWTADCWHESYNGAPDDGSAWTDSCTDSSKRAVRGGSWVDLPMFLRSAGRARFPTEKRNSYLGFRVGRLLPFPRML